MFTRMFVKQTASTEQDHQYERFCSRQILLILVLSNELSYKKRADENKRTKRFRSRTEQLNNSRANSRRYSEHGRFCAVQVSAVHSSRHLWRRSWLTSGSSSVNGRSTSLVERSPLVASHRGRPCRYKRVKRGHCNRNRSVCWVRERSRCPCSYRCRNVDIRSSLDCASPELSDRLRVSPRSRKTTEKTSRGCFSNERQKPWVLIGYFAPGQCRKKKNSSWMKSERFRKNCGDVPMNPASVYWRPWDPAQKMSSTLSLSLDDRRTEFFYQARRGTYIKFRR